ncbi:MAG: hypothetical protein MZW92_73760 [Comamonadaceae bacterium]|nr:hypothetical protein [Comamonadaceae bacterium]
MIGERGLQACVARVVLKPIYGGQSGALSLRPRRCACGHTPNCWPRRRPRPLPDAACRLSTVTWPACCTTPAG